MSRSNPFIKICKERLKELLQEKKETHKRLKSLLGIKTKSQHLNAIEKYKRGSQQNRMDKNVRAFQAYIRIGKDISRIEHAMSMKDE